MLLNSPEFSNFVAQLFFNARLRAKLAALLGLVQSSISSHASSILHPHVLKKGQDWAASFRNQRQKPEQEHRLEGY